LAQKLRKSRQRHRCIQPEQALLKLYGFTSDEGGIRHALLEETSLSYADAKFMLVLCSAFTNFLLTRCAEAGLKLK
jgi:hypothetical protein